MDEVLSLINDAATTQNWVLLSAAVALLAVPIVLKALGKNVPGLDKLTPIAVGFLQKLKKPAPKPEEQPENQPGLAAVIQIDDARKPTDKGPQP